MNKLILTFLCCLVNLVSSYAQRSESEIALKEYFSDAEFFLTQEFYADALNDYLQVYRRGYKNNANINYRIGICYLNIAGQKNKAIEYLEKAKESVSPKYRESSLKEKNAPIDVYLYLGNAYRVNNRLKEAINSYNKYKELLPEEETNLHEYANQQIEASNIAIEFMKEPVEVEFINLGTTINQGNENFKAVVSGDGTTLVYMHKLPFYNAVYFSKKIDNKWSEPENITPQLMSDGDQFVTSISFDGKMLFLSREDAFNSDIYVSYYMDNRWTKSVPLGANINTKYWESHASVSKDGETLYFTSNRKGNKGEMDIYIAHLNDEGKWGPAVNIGETINSKLNEDTPFITEDEKILYFSSQGFRGMGGYDIFKSERISEKEWSMPQNLGYPINTTDDDLFYFPWNNGEIAYMAKIMEEGHGATDIYQVVYPVEVEESIAEQPETTEAQNLVEILTKSPVDITDSTEVEEKEPVEVSEIKTIVISPVLFGFDKYILSETGKSDIKPLIGLLKSNEDVYVELLGYTDPLGPAEYNLKLAKKRALAVMNYLIEQGIDAGRLKPIEKGEVDFIAVNTHSDGSDNSEGRKYNRRVEFEVLGIDKNVIIIKRIDPVPDHLKVH
ncbi:MAG: OmpA family protein [Bacteroidales bacterium]|nr:OmpA family protein [Bacteroidales bacterium]